MRKHIGPHISCATVGSVDRDKSNFDIYLIIFQTEGLRRKILKIKDKKKIEKNYRTDR